MKKIKRIIAALLLCILALNCAGCANLDEMKASHAIWKDEAQTTLELNGETYKRLSVNNHFEIWEYDDEAVFVTAEDVPVLLSEQFGTRMDISKDHIILESSWYENDRYIFYCRADKYDEVAKQVVEGVSLDLMVYDYWNDESGETITYTLTAEQKNAVEAVLKTQPTSLGVNGYAEDYGVWLYRRSKNHPFGEMIGNLSVLNGEYRIIMSIDDDLCYYVPAELNTQFDQIMKKYREYRDERVNVN